MSELRDPHSADPPLSSDAAEARGAGVFATTHWSVVLLAGEATTPESAAALDQLCRQYWQPLYFFVRRRGYHEKDAQDLVQGFFARLLEKDLFSAADRERGRLRTFLLTALENYLINERERAHRLKRGGGQEIFSLDDSANAEAGYRLVSRDNQSPDQLFDRRWAQAILERVLRRLRDEINGRNSSNRYDTLKDFIFSDRGETSYGEAAAKIGLSESATKSAIYRLRKRYGELFAEEITRTVERPEDVREEIRHILSVLDGN